MVQDRGLHVSSSSITQIVRNLVLFFIDINSKSNPNVSIDVLFSLFSSLSLRYEWHRTNYRICSVAWYFRREVQIDFDSTALPSLSTTERLRQVSHDSPAIESEGNEKTWNKKIRWTCQQWGVKLGGPRVFDKREFGERTWSERIACLRSIRTEAKIASRLQDRPRNCHV